MTTADPVASSVASATKHEARILVIDDEVAAAELVARTLTRAGYTNVRTTSDSAGAMALAEAWGPDLLLLDLHMPVVDGYELLEQLRASKLGERLLPVLVLTGDNSVEARRRALAGGATEFVAKPLDLLEVVLRVNNLLELRFLQQALHQRNEDLEAELARRLRQHLHERQELIGQLVQAQEAERARIASEVHDDSIQNLVGVAMFLELLRDGAPGHEEEIDRLVLTCRGTVERLRNLIFDLRSPMLDELGLAGVLREQLAWSCGNRWKLEIDGEVSALPRAQTVQLVRIAQAAVTNACQHAEFDLVRVGVRVEDGRAELTVADDGQGFDVAAAEAARRPGHIGLAVMRERATQLGGTLDIVSEPGVGTTVRATLPLIASMDGDGVAP